MADEVSLPTVLEAIESAQDTEQLEEIRLNWLGKKGWITQEMKKLSDLPSDQRRERGQRLNEWRRQLLAAIDERLASLEEASERAILEVEKLDLSLPGRLPQVGLLHPLTRVRRRIEEVLMRLGFSVAIGPEIESEWHNFEALNMPANHPARDMQDTFFVDVPQLVLRTHTSPVQIRSMHRAQGSLPLKIIAPGTTYRRDDDATHVPMFQQVEGLYIDQGVSLAHLKGVLTVMVRELVGSDVDTRFRPSYFPFTEPSVEMDVTCAVCRGQGCRVCKGTGWVEILGSGMVHPVVLKNGGYHPQEVSGFAFGMGIERIAMRIFGVDDLRLLYLNDMRYLRGFQTGGDRL